MRMHITRTFTFGMFVLALLAACGGSREAPQVGEFEKEFRAAPSEYGLYVRWQWPGPNVTQEEVRRQIKALADEGFAGAELTVFAGGRDWNTDAWNEAVMWALEAAKEYGITLDFMLTVGTISIPGMAVDADAAEKKLVSYATKVVLPAGSDGKSVEVSLDYPEASGVYVSGRLIGLTYAEVVRQDEETVTLDADSVGVLYENNEQAGFVSGGRYTLEELLGVTDRQELEGYDPATGKFAIASLTDAMLTVSVDLPANSGEADKTYYLFSFWELPSGKTFGFSRDQNVNNTTIDHLSREGAQAVIDAYESSFDKTPGMRELLQEVGGAWFGDSLELTTQGEWTRDMLNEFYTRNGYDILPYIVAVTGDSRNRMGFGFPPAGMMGLPGGGAPNMPPPNDRAFGRPAAPSGPSYQFETVQDQVVNTYYDTVTDLFIENHLETLQAWSARYDMKIRYQSTYGYRAYMGKASLFIDIPETESLQYADQIDGYRGQSGAVHLGKGTGIYSSEVGETREQWLYMATWNDFLWRANRFFAVGGNQNVYHVFPYPTNSDDEQEVWPGMKAQPNVGDNLSTNFPSFTYLDNYSDYIARTQRLLQEGTARVDLAIYRHAWNNNRNDLYPFYEDDSLDRLGYSYDFLDPAALDVELATVSNGVLAGNGPAYKALVFNGQKDLPLATARTLVTLARAGLPMVFIGGMPDQVAYFPGSSGGVATDADEVRILMQELADLPGVVQVEEKADVPGALDKLGVSPDASYAPTTLLAAHRASAGVDYYFLYNQEKYYGDDYWTPPAQVTARVSFRGQVADPRPFVLDLWTGEITPIAAYTMDAEGRITVEVSLPGNDTAVIAIAAASAFGGRDVPDTHVTDTSGNGSYRYGDDGSIVLRATQNGPYTAVLADGETVTREVSGLPEARALDDWHLAVTSWAPGEVSYEVAKEVVFDAPIGAAVSWNTLGELPNGQAATAISGVGVYTANLSWDGAAADGAYLDLGDVHDLYQVFVNDTPVYGSDIVDTRVDIGPYLEDGDNTLRVEVASNVYNAMNANELIGIGAPGGGVKNDPAPWTPTEFGLRSGVTLNYYKDETILQ